MKFNVEKCELLNLGFRKPPETDFELCGETIKKAEKNRLKILDVLFNKSKFNTMKGHYTTYFTSKHYMALNFSKNILS